MKKIFGIIAMISGILLFGGLFLCLVIGSIIVAFDGHWSLGTFMILFWTGMISFYIYEKL
jgi:enoyl-CoA hydratase/carnithine racemase